MNSKPSSKYSIRLLKMAFQPATLCPSHPSSSRPTEKKVVQALLYRIGFCAVQNLIRYSQDWMAFSWYWREWIKKFSRAVRIRNKEMKYSIPTRKRHLAYTINRSFPSCLWSLLKKIKAQMRSHWYENYSFKFTSKYKSSLQGRLANSMQHKNRFHYS